MCVCSGVQRLVEQQTQKVLMFHSTVSEARANADAMTHIIQVSIRSLTPDQCGHQQCSVCVMRKQTVDVSQTEASC